jgi:two-component system, cell cycle sensor histidine kinase and response regulator CckA
MVRRDDASLFKLLEFAAIAANEASDIRTAAALCLEETRRVTGWPVGHLYLLSPEGDRMVPSGIWSLADANAFARFQDVTNRTELKSGIGLPGRVFEARQPLWIKDTEHDPNFPRAAVAASVGLHAGFGFPILTGLRVMGVMEFFAFEAIEPDETFLAIVAQVGRQLGRVVERERTAEYILSSEARFRSVARSATDAIVLADERGKIMFANASTEVMFGYLPDTLVGTPLTALMPARFREDHATGLARVRDGGPSRVIGRVVELVGLRRDGTEFPIELSLSTWESQGQRCFSGIIRDISDRKAAENDARQQEERLRQAARMEGIGALAGGIAHDFNNVLTAIFGCTDMLLEDIPIDSPLRENVMVIRDAADRAAAMTRQLLAFGRRQILRVVTIDVNRLITKLHKMLSRLLPESIHFELRLYDGLPPINADYSQIEQVVMNLVVNARDAMPGGGSLIVETSAVNLDEGYVAVHPGTKPGPHVLVAITDTGVGMDTETQQRIFEPFFTTKGHTGTGLGLSTVYGIVQQSGGSIWVYSEPGQGTTFKLYFPAATAQIISAAPQPLARGVGSENVLIVEDDEAIRRVGVRVLRNEGYSVLQAASAEEALEIDAQALARVDLMITDVVLPGLNGRQLADSLRSTYPNMRVLFVSGYTEDAIVHHGVLDEGVAFLPKPFSPRALLGRVRAMLDS